jgi:2-desacetyl-2-hydroxyethyl bacteriochlorophyllide A dehydrogenase
MNTERIIFKEVKKVVIESIPLMKIKDNEILVKTMYSLISVGTEMINLLGMKRTNKYPYGPGYSAVGEVIDVGKDVKNVKKGDKVWISSMHQTYAVIPYLEHNCLILNEDDPFMDITFLALGKVALHGVRRLGIQINESVAVFGLGVVGQLSVQIAKLAGAFPVIGIDLLNNRCKIAMKCGADFVINVGEKDLITEINKITHNDGIRVIIECSGSSSVIPSALKIASYGGRIAIVGGIHRDFMIDLYTDFQTKELSLIGARQVTLYSKTPFDYWNLVENCKTILNMIRTKKLNIKPLITKVVKFKDVLSLYDSLIKGENKDLGIVIDFT